MNNNTSNRGRGGPRPRAGRVQFVKRYYTRYYLSKDEEQLLNMLVTACREMETNLIREIALKLKCRQYQVGKPIYERMLALEKELLLALIEDLMKNKAEIKKTLLEEFKENPPSTHKPRKKTN